MKIEKAAKANFERYLRQNPYPGRGLVIGRASEDNWVILYWIMGRSANSRNRRFAADGGVLRTEPVDLSLVTDPSLIIYEAMLELPGVYLVSNGDQTRTMYDAIQAGKTMADALATREREPDAPNYTPRICGMLDFRGGSPAVTLSILKANPADPGHTDRFYFRVAMPTVGLGVGVTTYSGDGAPLPSFAGDPLLLPCAERAEDTLEMYWDALDASNRISIAAKEIRTRGADSRILVRNRF
jgi:hypothetical protein